MKVFIWHQIDHVSDNYHSDGGLVVFAQTEERARELANQEPGCELSPEEMPDRVTECHDCEEQVFIMPNAGCC